ncbi:ABC transporter substrate-binding protein [Thalassospira sp.]|uniref:substrate-binding periplasmic protein n=1 Tax=Thalassospira sp. TaxID=1912094 RepID=UPI002732423E|nr:ABC transporter substrate-binding protein [Thalassospira sp.]MDP2699492.1 ABC transporter substrate-binding protein [Thalassospira sp.]
MAGFRAQFRKFRGLCRVLLPFVLLMMPIAAQARTLIIEGLNEAPLKWDDNGVIRGIDIDIMRDILSEMGIDDYEFRLVDSGKRLLYNARNGSSDIVLTLSKSTDRQDFGLYPDIAHLILDWRFVIRAADRNHIRFNDLPDLAPWRIGAAAGFSYTPEFWNAGLDIETVAKNDLLIPMLLQKRFDVVPVNFLSTLYETLDNGLRPQLHFLETPLRRAAYYNVMSKASDYPDKEKFLRRYDAILLAMRNNGRLAQIYQDYLGPDGLDWWRSQQQTD